MRHGGKIVLATLLLTTGALAAPKKVTGYDGLGVTAGKGGGSYTLVIGDSPQAFNYYGVIDNNLGLIAQQVFDGLVEFNYKTYKLEPALAESWTVSPDGKVYTLKLRQGVKWHDGKPLTADDLVFTWEYARDPATAAVTAGSYKDCKVEKVDGELYNVEFATFEAVKDSGKTKK